MQLAGNDLLEEVAYCIKDKLAVVYISDALYVANSSTKGTLGSRICQSVFTAASALQTCIYVAETDTPGLPFLVLCDRATSLSNSCQM